MGMRFSKKKLLFSCLELLFFLLIILLPSNQMSAQASNVTFSCNTNSTEPHPLRPYPGEICGPVESPDQPYCAMRPWAYKTIEYMKNMQDCSPSDPAYPCIKETVAGDYTIDLKRYELPLVSINRPGFENWLSFFNRAQEHLADYLEGRTFYEGIVENLNTTEGRIAHWNRAGVIRKLLPLLPHKKQTFSQDQLRLRMIKNAGITHHDYIVGYQLGGEPAPWGTGTPVRLSDFRDPNRQAPEYTCHKISDPALKQNCIEVYFRKLLEWQQTIYGKLWPYVPLFTREDTVGYVSLLPDPGVAAPSSKQTNQVSIPHLNRLNQVSSLLQKMLTSNNEENPAVSEENAYEGWVCPAGPWGMSGSACAGGPTCEYHPANCNPEVNASDSCAYGKEQIENLASLWVSGAEGNQVDRCYGDTIKRAQNTSNDPALTMWIWLHESNASNYYISSQDFGVIPPTEQCNYDAQITAHLEKLSAYQANYPQCFGSNAPVNPATGQPMTCIEAYLWIYKSGGCDPNNSAGMNFVENAKEQYELVSPCPFPTNCP
jgi:hypothetical protein